MMKQTRQWENASHGEGGLSQRRNAAAVRGPLAIGVLVLIVAGASGVVAPAREPLKPRRLDPGSPLSEGEPLLANTLIEVSTAEPIEKESPIHRGWVVTKGGIFLIACFQRHFCLQSSFESESQPKDDLFPSLRCPLFSDVTTILSNSRRRALHADHLRTKCRLVESCTS